LASDQSKEIFGFFDGGVEVNDGDPIDDKGDEKSDSWVSQSD